MNAIDLGLSEKGTAAPQTQENIREQALKKHGLDHLDIQWPKNSAHVDEVDYKTVNPATNRQMYGENDLSKLPLFEGGFINFGVWSDELKNATEITAAHRARSSELMYQVIADQAGICSTDSVADIGCGLGQGCAFIQKQYQPRHIVGIDASPDQIARARAQRQSAEPEISFEVGGAECIPLPSGIFDHIISIEAAQHFASIPKFIQESIRILKPGGKLTFTTFFATNQEGVQALRDIVPDYAVHCSDLSIDAVTKIVQKDMHDVRVSSIGKQVWDDLERWLKYVGYDKQWTMIWPALYRKGLLDYVIIEARSPA